MGLLLGLSLPANAEERADRLNASDIFKVQFASDPQISPDGKRIVYVRAFADIMSDKRLSNLWMIGFDGSDDRAITTGNFTRQGAALRSLDGHGTDGQAD
jgi:acylaminoacyl-peptidase